MRRGILIDRSHRQQTLVNSILGHQPLVARLARHQQLAQALGLPGLHGQPVSQARSVLPGLTGTIPALPTVGRNFRAALINQPEGASDAHIVAQSLSTQVYEESIPVQPSVEMVAQQESSMQQQQLALHQDSAQLNVKIDAPSIPPTPAMVERLDQLSSAEKRVVDQLSLQVPQPAASVEVTVPALEPVKTIPVPADNVVAEDIAEGIERGQGERLTTDEAVPTRVGEGPKSPIETVRPRRPRRSIEELTAPSEHRSPSATPSKKESQEPRRNVQAAMTEQQPETKSTGEDKIHADELFAPTNTDRSPQAWLARLMGKSIPAQEEVVSHTVMGQDLPVESGVSEASPDEGSSLSLSQQSGVQRQEVKESLIHPSQPGYSAISQQSDEQGSTVKGQRQKKAGRANTLHAVPGEPGKPGMAEAVRTAQLRQPEQLSSRTRRFLRPLLGIDPASVRVHRDAQATRLADAYHADAVTVGEAVELPTSNASETQETLGLLAHELTHVARQREPGFVPPILQAQQDVGDGSEAYIVEPPLAGRQSGRLSEPGAGGLGASVDEEALALQVERQVRQVAREQVRQQGTIIPPAQDSVSLSPAMPFAPNEPVETRRVVNDPWGDLPAPWEPLPGWLTTPVPQGPTEQSVASFPAAAPAPAASTARPMASNGSQHQASGNTDVGVQRAEIGRPIGEEASAIASSSSEARAPEPDLDELARQVYSILRNRLEVERRRHR